MAEITTTQSFSDGDTVTATKLNNIQANASVQPEAITNRSAETTIDQANDLLLIYDASATALKKVSASNLIKAGTASDFPITGNATIGGTLGVTGTSTLTGAITATSTINGTTIPTSKTLVTTVDTQTLTNKTLTSPSISDPTITGQITASTSTINVGSGQIYKDASGNVGVGTASPAQLLHVSKNSGAQIRVDSGISNVVSAIGSSASAGYVGTTSNDSFQILTNNTERLRIDSSGNVGVGETNPTFKMEIVSSSSYLTLKLKEPSALANVGPTIRFQAKNASGNYWDCGTISVRNTSASMTAGAESSYMSFYTTTAGAEAERLRINSSGDVGIGTSSPVSKLDVRGTGSFYAGSGTAQSAIMIFNNSTNGAYLSISGAGSASAVPTWIDGSIISECVPTLGGNYIIGAYTGNLCFHTNNRTERLRIDSSGNVGVGTDSPSCKLQVGKTTDSSNLAKVLVSSTGIGYIGVDSTGIVSGCYLVTNNSGSTQNGIPTATSGILSQGSQPFILTTNSVERLRIDSSGGLILAGSTAQKASGTTWSNPSDERIKKNIRDYEKGLNSLMQIRVREWEYNGKAGTVNDSKNIGVVADEIENVLPDTVSTYNAKLNEGDENDSQIKKFDASEVTWLLVKAVQELSAKVTALEAA
jgi:hypothetical protein